jgi:hypothetical protein
MTTVMSSRGGAPVMSITVTCVRKSRGTVEMVDRVAERRTSTASAKILIFVIASLGEARWYHHGILTHTSVFFAITGFKIYIIEIAE